MVLRIAFGLCAAIATLLMWVTPVAAQCLLCPPGSGGTAEAGATDRISSADRPLRVDVTADLDFSRLVSGGGGGSVTISPEGSGRTLGQLALVGGLGFSGRVRIEGAPGRQIRVDMPDEVLLTSSNGRSVHVRDIETNLPPAPRLGADGRLEFAFGGRLETDGDSDGDYRGRIQVTVTYE